MTLIHTKEELDEVRCMTATTLVLLTAGCAPMDALVGSGLYNAPIFTHLRGVPASEQASITTGLFDSLMIVLGYAEQAQFEMHESNVTSTTEAMLQRGFRDAVIHAWASDEEGSRAGSLAKMAKPAGFALAAVGTSGIEIVLEGLNAILDDMPEDRWLAPWDVMYSILYLSELFCLDETFEVEYGN